MKPPKKVVRPNTPDTDAPGRNPAPEDGNLPWRNLPGLGTSEPTTGLPGHRQPQGGSDNTPSEPPIRVVDISTQGPPVIGTVDATSSINFLPPALVPKLSSPDSQGLRHGQRNSMYAEIENEGVTLVRRREDGEYQSSSATELKASGPILERIAGTPFWRRKPTGPAEDPSSNPHPASVTDPQPGPSAPNRPRPDEGVDTLAQTHPILVDLLTQPSSPLDLSAALWKNWGSSTKHPLLESLEIDGLHYQVVPRGSLPNNDIAFLQHPRFPPSRYEAFEQMLHENPSQQPRWAIKKNGQWAVLDTPLPFENSLTGLVARTFRDLSDTSLNNVAKSLFNRADHSDIFNASGLMVLNQTYRNWASPSRFHIPRPELADPLLMLPITNRTSSNGWLATPPANAQTLRRLDFSPDRFPALWSNYTADPSNYNLKLLVATVLTRNGYNVFPLSHEHQGPTLVFTRAGHDTVFFMKLGRVDGHSIRDVAPPGNELSDPHLTTRIGAPARTALMAAYDQSKVVWLLGGTQTTSTGWQSVFIIREG